MPASTVIATFFVPLFFVLLETLNSRLRRKKASERYLG